MIEADQKKLFATVIALSMIYDGIKIIGKAYNTYGPSDWWLDPKVGSIDGTNHHWPNHCTNRPMNSGIWKMKYWVKNTTIIQSLSNAHRVNVTLFGH